MQLRAALQRRMAEWIRRRQGPDRLPLALNRRRLYILPTRAGWGFALVLLGMLVAGLNYGNSLALFLTFWLAALALVTMHQCHRNLVALRLTHVSVTPAFAQGRSLVRLGIANDSTLARYRVTLSCPEAERVGAATLDLPAQLSGVLSLTLRAGRRGVYPLPRLLLSTTHPFGLFRVWTYLHAPLEWVVYPCARGTRPPPPPTAAQDSGTLRGGADEQEWLGLRAFRSGDSPRQVAWKSYARGGPLLTKEYTAQGVAIRRLTWRELSLPLEPRLEQLSRWVVDAEARGEHYSLELPGFSLPADRGPAQLQRALTALARHASPPQADVAPSAP